MFVHGDVSEFMFAVFTMRGRVVDCAVEEMVSVVSYLRIGISLSRDSVLVILFVVSFMMIIIGFCL